MACATEVREDDKHGLVVELSAGTSRASVHAFGAHVTKYCVDDVDVLFLSKRAVLDRSKAIRGGIPVCWPQFGPHGPLNQHGFARTTVWTLRSREATTESAVCEFELHDTEESRKVWPYRFKVSLKVSLSNKALAIDWLVENASDAESFEMSGALHSYFAVNDIHKVSVGRFEPGSSFVDDLDNFTVKKNDQSTVSIDAEFDRVYLASSNQVDIVEDGVRTIHMQKSDSLPDAVVWNPWEHKAKGMSDFGDEEYKSMVCVEPALFHRVQLEPRASWRASVAISVR
mmetsp:Transcript_15539/g.41792  ORF Transcript_15539/g.41792 Transcript_15539/m.41792 type:complete len:285 (+) Transcript_15539:190-1044(+)